MYHNCKSNIFQILKLCFSAISERFCWNWKLIPRSTVGILKFVKLFQSDTNNKFCPLSADFGRMCTVCCFVFEPAREIRQGPAQTGL